jgi:hypothetical protein
MTYQDRNIDLAGTYSKNITPNATYDARVDCGSHCKDYGINGTESTTERWPFCMVHEDTTQPDKISGCPPVEGFALTTIVFGVMPWFRVPVGSFCTLPSHC